MNIEQLSGLEVIQAIIDGKLPNPSISETMPMTMMRAENGFVEFQVQADNRHLNPMGGVHGGFAATILDSVTGCATHTTLPAKTIYATVDLNVKMVKAMPIDTPLIATGKVIAKSRTIATSEGFIKDANGTIYAHGSATCVIKA
ncbi:PaaI family thioesterase [Colwellia sp. MEBiC06753]